MGGGGWGGSFKFCSREVAHPLAAPTEKAQTLIYSSCLPMWYSFVVVMACPLCLSSLMVWAKRFFIPLHYDACHWFATAYCLRPQSCLIFYFLYTVQLAGSQLTENLGNDPIPSQPAVKIQGSEIFFFLLFSQNALHWEKFQDMLHAFVVMEKHAVISCWFAFKSIY